MSRDWLDAVRRLIRWAKDEARTRTPPGGKRLTLETLEGRCVPAALMQWLGGGGNNLWSNGANWGSLDVNRNGTKPQNGDTVYLVNAAGAEDTVADDATLTELASLVVGNGKKIDFGSDLKITGALTLTSGQLDGGGELQLTASTSSFTWGGGGIGTKIIIGTATVGGQAVTFDGDDKTFANGGILESYGNVTWTSGNINLSRGILSNLQGGVFDIQADVSLTGDGGVYGAFENSGTLKKSKADSPGGVSVVDASFINFGDVVLQAGTLSLTRTAFQEKGSTRLEGGNLACDTYDLDGGTLLGVGSFTGNLVNSGQQEPTAVFPGVYGVGKLTIYGNYTQQNSGRASTHVHVAADGSVNVLDVRAIGGSGGTATISGGNVIITRDPNFAPPLGTTRTFLESVSRTGTFNKAVRLNPISWVNNGNLLHWDKEASGTNYNIVVKPAGAAAGGAWNDANRNNKRDAGEAAVANATVTLTLPDATTQTTTTNSEGDWEFDNLANGNYTVSIAAPTGSGLVLVLADQGSDDAIDSDFSPSSGAVSFTLSSGTPTVDLDAGYYSTPTYGGTSTSLSVSSTSVVPHQSVTLTASVSPTTYGGPTVAGTVYFYDGTAYLGSGTLSSGMMGVQATLTTSFSTTGSHSITAVYQGNANYGGSTSSPATVTVQKGSVIVMLSSSSYSPQVGVTLTLTASVSGGSSVLPTGDVEFWDNGTLLGTVQLSQGMMGAHAQLTFSFPTSGSHTVTAVWAGDDSFFGNSASQTWSVSP